MRIIRCDRCGKEMPWKDTDNVGHVALRWKDIRTDELAGLNPYEDVEFCDDCMRAISDFIEKKPAIVAVEPAAVEEKPKAPTAKRKIDTGKIKALYEAGRTIQWIAGDLKYSENAVRYHLDKMGLRGERDDGD